MRSLLVLLTLPIAVASPAQPQAPEVLVSGGTVRGEAADGRLLFRGIPFAAPPLANRRWSPPAQIISWSGVREASSPAPACLQNDFGWNRSDHAFSNEDCLTLDVGTQRMDGRRPVLVWIHGGSNRAGGPGDIASSPLVDAGLVVVGVRYRLGIFGFLAHRRLADGLGRGTGNYGLMDQISALRWVRDNIALFGGDPGNVTIAGESAGAQDVSLLLAAPQARGLFAKAIIGSGSPGFGLPLRPLEEAFRLGEQLDEVLASQGDGVALAEVPASTLLDADRKLHDPVLTSDDYLYLRTTIDGAVLDADPRDLLTHAPARPTIVGTNALELDLPGGKTVRDAFVRLAFGAENEVAARRAYNLGGADPDVHPRFGTIDQIIATDATFRCPARRLARLLAAEGSKVYRYQFDAAPDGGQTRHALELGYFYGGQRLAGLDLGEYVVAFVKSGNPNGAMRPAWPLFEEENSLVLSIDNAGARAEPEGRTAVCNLGDHL